MKRKDFNELKTKTIADLKKLAVAKRLEAAKKKMAITGGKEKNLKSYGNIRHEIAKILTVIKEKQLVDQLEGQKTK